MVHIKKEVLTEPTKGHNLLTFQNDDDQKFNPLNLQVEAGTANTRAEVPICLMFIAEHRLLFWYGKQFLFTKKWQGDVLSPARCLLPVLTPLPPTHTQPHSTGSYSTIQFTRYYYGIHD